MIKAKVGSAWIFGIDKRNIRNLRKDKPLMIKKEETGLSHDLFIIYGDTLEDVARNIEQATGCTLPQFHHTAPKDKQ